MSKFKLTQTAAEVQSILNNCNGLKSDAEGNLTIGKNLGVDGKLTLKSLVSASNPDGDIAKELGGTANKLYKHTINCYSSTYGSVYLTIYNKSIEQINSASKFKGAILNIDSVIATGYIKYENNVYNVYYSRFSKSDKKVIAFGYRINNEGKMVEYSTFVDNNFSTFEDDVNEVR